MNDNQILDQLKLIRSEMAGLRSVMVEMLLLIQRSEARTNGLASRAEVVTKPQTKSPAD